MIKLSEYNERGFTLLEIAIVMVIIGLLAGGGVSLMGILSERKSRNETSEYLNDAKNALINFAKINGRLPWADNNFDGNEDTNINVGFFPYRTLGFKPSDSYRRVLRYELNSNLGSSLPNSCSALIQPSGLSGSPLVIDSDGSTSAFSVAAVLVSAGQNNADSAGPGNLAFFDAVTTGSFTGDNTDGIPNYIRSTPSETFDDLVIYISGYELYGEICGDPVVVTFNNRNAGDIYIYNRTLDQEIGMVEHDKVSAPYRIVAGEQIEIWTASGGTGSPVTSVPPNPFIASGPGLAVDVPL
jgi:prepilin-type N-terminal cleavage/methylation domain-containing protein